MIVHSGWHVLIVACSVAVQLSPSGIHMQALSEMYRWQVSDCNGQENSNESQHWIVENVCHMPHPPSSICEAYMRHQPSVFANSCVCLEISVCTRLYYHCLESWCGHVSCTRTNSFAEGSSTIRSAYDLKRVGLQVLLKNARTLLKVPFKRASDGTFVEVASLAQIYKVFERC